MPIYDYQCPSCFHDFELKQSYDADPYAICPRCEAVSRRQFHPVPVIYKGSGFYTTDYARSGSRYGGTAKSQAKAESGSTEAVGAASES